MTRVLATVLSLLVTLAAQGTALAAPNDLEKTVFVHSRNAPASSGPVERFARGSSACPDPATCPDNKWRGNKWAGATVTYELNAGRLNASAAVVAGFAAWTGIVKIAGGSLTVSGSNGSTSCDSAGTTRNGINQVCWRDLTASFPNAIAVTFVWASRSTGLIAEADTVFNSGPGFTWSYTNPGACSTYTSCNTNAGAAGSYDIRDIATHEFGHFLALFGDLYNARDTELTMYGIGSTGETKKDSLGKGDCLGITAAYGGTCP